MITLKNKDVYPMSINKTILFNIEHIKLTNSDNCQLKLSNCITFQSSSFKGMNQAQRCEVNLAETRI